MSDVATYTLEIGATDVSADLLPGISWSRGMDQLRIFSPPKAGDADAGLRNDEGTYNPGTSPLAAGQDVVLTATHDGSPSIQFSGILDHPRHRGPSFIETTLIVAFGTLSRLANKRGLSSAVYQNIRTDEAIGLILDAADWPAADRVFDEGITTLRWFVLDEDDALRALREVLNSEGPSAQLYEDTQGRLVFRHRHAVFTETRSTDVQASYGPSDLPIVEPWSYEGGLRDVVNIATVKVVRRAAGSQQVLWEFGDEPIQFAADQTRRFRARVSDALILDAQTPAEADGDFSVTSGALASVSLNRTSGASVEISITAGANGATITDLRLRAKPVTVVSETEISNANHPLSAGETPRPYSLDVRPDLDPLVAQDFVDAVVEFYRGGRPQVSFSTVNVNDTALTSLLARDIGDRVHVTIPRLGIDEDLIVLQREDSLGMGQLHQVTFGCEEIIDVDLFLLDTDALDVDALSF